MMSIPTQGVALGFGLSRLRRWLTNGLVSPLPTLAGASGVPTLPTSCTNDRATAPNQIKMHPPLAALHVRLSGWADTLRVRMERGRRDGGG